MIDVQFAAAVQAHMTGEQVEVLIRQISEAGFAGIQLLAEEIEAEEKAANVRSLCYAHQIAPVSAILTLRGEADTAPGRRRFEAALDALDGLGGEALVVTEESGSALPSSGVVEVMQSVGEACGERGMKAAYLPPAANLEAGEERLEALLARLPEDQVVLALNLKQASAAERPGLESLLRWGGRAAYLITPASASAEFLQALAEDMGRTRFSGWIVVEGAGEAGEEGVASLASARESLRDAFGC